MTERNENWDALSLVSITSNGAETTLLLDEDADRPKSPCSCTSGASSDVLVLIRLNNLLLLIIITVLIASGHGRLDNDVMHLSIASWSHPQQPEPELYEYLDAKKQFLAFGVSLTFTALTLLFLIKQCKRRPLHKIFAWIYAFSAIPCMLGVFCVEVYYANCPWLDFYYRRAVIDAHPAVMSTAFHIQRHKCTMTAWSAAAGLCLISSGLFVTDGLVSCLTRPYQILTESSSTLTITSESSLI